MTRNSDPRRPTLGLLAVLSGVLLASCQTSADDVLSLGDAAASEEASATSSGRKTFRDPYVVAISGQAAEAPVAQASQNETDQARLKRKPVPLAAAFTDIAEPPPEVLALQQQATEGQAQPTGQASPPANLGELTMQPTTVAPGSNSLFSAGQRNQAGTAADPAAPPMAVAEAAPSGSLVPGEMPTLGVNAVRKSLFSPSAEQQMLMQQQALQEQAPASAGSLPLTDQTSTEEPILKKLSDPRPKRKMLALRESETSVPEQVQLTPDQLQAMGAVEEADPAEPLPAEELVANAEPSKKKKAWLPSLKDMLKGGKKTEQDVAAP
ncbi:hypothetical protein [Rhizobium rhizophilum]|uniref:Flagellar hook-length control protein FliK n=1 Tax=Rhizobium rhizophilum TaxID=1850373 RepID=A0ABY2QSL9_9HYPH|nr:hypothetical protein [Rhizobium rhizophilum]THV13588.1 hypothetical protein E9677_11740 [Rhizobium rhizophilum]